MKVSTTPNSIPLAPNAELSKAESASRGNTQETPTSQPQATSRSSVNSPDTVDQVLRHLNSPMFGDRLGLRESGFEPSDRALRPGSVTGNAPGRGNLPSLVNLGRDSLDPNAFPGTVPPGRSGEVGPGSPRTGVGHGGQGIDNSLTAGGPNVTSAQPSAGGSIQGGSSLSTQVESSMTDVQTSNGGQSITQETNVTNDDGSTYHEVSTHESDGEGNSTERTEITHTDADGTVETHTTTTTTNADGSSTTTTTESTTEGGSEESSDSDDSSAGSPEGDTPEDANGTQDAGHTVGPTSPMGGTPTGGGSPVLGGEPHGKDPRVTNPNPDETHSEGDGGAIPRKENGFSDPEGYVVGDDGMGASGLGTGGWDDPRVINPSPEN